MIKKTEMDIEEDKKMKRKRMKITEERVYEEDYQRRG